MLLRAQPQWKYIVCGYTIWTASLHLQTATFMLVQSDWALFLSSTEKLLQLICEGRRQRIRAFVTTVSDLLGDFARLSAGIFRGCGPCPVRRPSLSRLLLAVACMGCYNWLHILVQRRPFARLPVVCLSISRRAPSSHELPWGGFLAGSPTNCPKMPISTSSMCAEVMVKEFVPDQRLL